MSSTKKKTKKFNEQILRQFLVCPHFLQDVKIKVVAKKTVTKSIESMNCSFAERVKLKNKEAKTKFRDKSGFS